MTKKDYLKFAAALKALPAVTTRAAVVLAIADILAADNSSFDRDRFVTACAVSQ